MGDGAKTKFLGTEMRDEGLDLAALANFLHKPIAEVQKLAERGKVPGRRVGGNWRFIRAEISEWLTARMGQADAEELQSMEDVLNNPRGSAPLGSVSLTDLLSLERIAVPLSGKSRSKVIASMVELPAAQGLVWDAAAFESALLEREEMMSTALETGVALLHPRRPMPSILGDYFLALGITSSGIPFGGSHGRLTDIFFLIGALEDRWHLRVLAKLSRLAASYETLEALRSCESGAAVLETVTVFEQSQNS